MDPNTYLADPILQSIVAKLTVQITLFTYSKAIYTLLGRFSMIITSDAIWLATVGHMLFRFYML